MRTEKKLENDAGMLICCRADSLVRTSRLRDRVEALLQNLVAACGKSISGSFAKFDPSSFLWKTSQCSFLEGLESFSETWPQSGMMQNGNAFRQPSLDRLIDVTEFGLLPTPAAMECEGNKAFLRKAETWENVSSLTALLIGIKFKLKGRERKPSYRIIVIPTFVEWMMGLPDGWTDLNVAVTAKSFSASNGSVKG